MKNILVTGGAGFIGSNFLQVVLNKYDSYNIINLDKLTYASDLKNLEYLKEMSRYTFIQGDISDLNFLQNLFNQYSIDHVIHFAAESHVDNSISSPGEFVKTNIVGTFNLLNCAYHHWMEKPFTYKKDYSDSRFHHISTDEVYGTLGETGYFTETTPYAPNSPYSASKASSDMLVRSYYHTFGLNVVTTNCSNNYGPFQHDEKLIPTIIRNALSGNDIPIYGNGKNIRDWLFVEDHCHAILKAFEKGNAGETYNIGSNNEKTNIQIAHIICEILDKIKPQDTSYKNQITFVQDRPGHDLRYAIDASKIKSELNWMPQTDFAEGIEKTVKWYLKKYKTR